jgi:predicted RNA-binding protein with TRAM domain
MERSAALRSLFNAELLKTEDGYVLEVPRHDVENGTLSLEEVYRVAVTGGQAAEEGNESAPSDPQPPVEIGEIRYVEIEDMGDQGDGIARVERGYVIIVPETTVGDRVKVAVSKVESNFAVGEIVDEGA